MRPTVVVFVVVAVVAMASAAVVQKSGTRLRVQEARIARLSAHVQALEELADERAGNGAHDALSGLQARLDNAFGSDCGNQFSCSGLSKQCVSPLEVCDGAKDCENNHDEDEDTCRLIPEAGSRWKGGKVRDDCSNRHPYEMEVVFTDTSSKAWFTSRASLNAIVILKSSDRSSVSVASLKSQGYYNFADRTVELSPPEDDGLALDVVFDTVLSDSANAYITRESTGEHCAHFVLFKQ